MGGYRNENYQRFKGVVTLIVEDEEKMMSIFSETSWYKENLKEDFFNHLRHNSYFTRFVKVENVTQSFVDAVFLDMLKNKWYMYRPSPFVEVNIVEFIYSCGFYKELLDLDIESVCGLLKSHAESIGRNFLQYCFYFDLDGLERYLLENSVE